MKKKRNGVSNKQHRRKDNNEIKQDIYCKKIEEMIMEKVERGILMMMMKIMGLESRVVGWGGVWGDNGKWVRRYYAIA